MPGRQLPSPTNHWPEAPLEGGGGGGLGSAGFWEGHMGGVAGGGLPGGAGSGRVGWLVGGV